MTIAKRKQQIIRIFEEYSYIFPENQKPTIKDALQKVILIPDDINIREVGGFPLRDNVGYISIKETISKDKEDPEAYMYKFCSDEYTYIFDKKHHPESIGEGSFNLHYQNDEDHTPHVSFLHPNVRCYSRKIKLDEFLFFIGETFFDKYQRRKLGLPWHSRFI